MTARLTAVWIDAGGRTAVHNLTSNPTAATVLADIAALSNAGVQLSWEGPLVAPVPAPVNATYPDVKDVATLLFSTSVGTIIKIAIPAPNASIFLADGETVDPTQIVTLIADVISFIISVGGAPAVAYQGGTRTPSG